SPCRHAELLCRPAVCGNGTVGRRGALQGGGIMDIPRKSAARQRLIRRIAFGTLIMIVAVAATVAVYRLKPAPPSVERSTVWVDAVKRGPIDRDVRGLGTLVPEETLLI